MEINVRQIAKLCCLEIPDQQLESCTRELQEMVEIIDEIPLIMDDTYSILDEEVMELREDIIQPSLPKEEILMNAPSTVQGCFAVPKTVE